MGDNSISYMLTETSKKLPKSFKEFQTTENRLKAITKNLMKNQSVE